MRKLALAFVVVLVVSTTACKCSPAARQAATEVEDSHRIILPEYLAYLNADPKLAADEKGREKLERRKALVESLDRLMKKLKGALNE